MGHSDLQQSSSRPSYAAGAGDGFQHHRHAVLRALVRGIKILAALGAIAGALTGILAMDLTMAQLGFPIVTGLLTGAMLVPAYCLIVRALQLMLWLLACSLQLGLLACCIFIVWHYLVPG